MKAHTSDFKENICLLGRELNSKISYTIDGVDYELSSEELNSISPHFQSQILKSAMRCLEIDSNVEIPKDTVIHFEFGVKVREASGNDDGYDYINYGDYIVKDVKKQEDTNSYKIIAYDFMLKSMIDYEALNITYPITIRNYIIAICEHLGLTFKNASDIFANYNREIQNELYLDSDNKSLGYTFRDVLDELSAVTASTICIDLDTNELEIRYITDIEDAINEEYLKDVNVNFGESFGPINTIVLSRAAESDNVYKSYPDNLPDDEKIEIKIIDNQIMNFNDRADYLPDILNKLYGLVYSIHDYSSTGICYYDICDRYNVQIGENTYSCVMFNDDVEITQGLEENVYTDMPEETNTDYTKADKDDRKINQIYLIVDKQNGQIQSLINNAVSVSDFKSGVGSITLENAYKGQLYQLSIKGDISLLFPQSEEGLYGYPLAPSDNLVPSNELTPSSPVPYQNKILYPSNDLFSKNTNLIVDDVKYKLDFDFLNYINNDICDEFVYDNGICYIIRRVGIDENGDKYPLSKEVREPRKSVIINIDKNSRISLESFDNAILKATYLLENVYTDNFTTEVEVQSEIKQTADSITSQVSANYATKGELATAKSEIKQTTDSISLEVSEKVGDDEIISKINQSAESVSISANKINLNGVVTANDNFKILTDGSMEAKNGTFKGVINTNQDCIIGNNLYVGQNQSSTSNLTKYIKLSDDTYIKRMYGNYEGLNLNTTYNMSFSVNDNNGNETNIFVADYYDIILQNINQYIWLHNGYISSSSDIISDSDKRLKQNIKDIDVSWIDDLKVKEFEYKKNPNIKHIGLIAQDYLDKEYSKNFVIKKEDGYYGIAYQSISNALIQYCQELKQEVENLKKEMEELKNGFNRISK